MIKEAIKTLEEVFEKNAMPDVKSVNGHANVVYQKGEDPAYINKVPPTPYRQMITFGDMLEYVTSRKPLMIGGFAIKPEIKENGDPQINVDIVSSDGSTVFYNEESIDYLETPHDLRGIHARLPLTPTEPWKFLKEKKWLSQKDFVRALRITMRGTMETDSLLKAARIVTVNNGAIGTGNVQTGKQSISREILNEVKSKDSDFPEEQRFTLKVFNEVDCKISVTCAIEIDTDKASPEFRLTPYPNEMEEAMTQTLDYVYQAVRGADVPCFGGRAANPFNIRQ